MSRYEYDIATGENRAVGCKPYLINGEVVLIDDTQPIPLNASPVPPVRLVPKAVTKRQGFLALLSAGLLDQVELVISSAPRAVQVTWATMQDFERDNPLISSLGSQLGLDDKAIDDLFVEASKL